MEEVPGRSLAIVRPFLDALPSPRDAGPTGRDPPFFNYRPPEAVRAACGGMRAEEACS